MRNKQAKDVLENLLKDAVTEGLLYPFGKSYSKDRPNSRKGIGCTINCLSKEDKELLGTLKSEDIKDMWRIP